MMMNAAPWLANSTLPRPATSMLVLLPKSTCKQTYRLLNGQILKTLYFDCGEAFSWWTSVVHRPNDQIVSTIDGADSVG